MKTTIILLLSIVWAFVSKAQNVISRQYSANEGLPSSYCFTSYQDKGGYLWVGTYGGVARFDGQKFINFTVNDGLITNQAISIFEDKQHRIWIGTFSGISVFQNGHFKNFTKVNNILIERVFGIEQDNQGTVWATCRQGLLRFDNADTEPKLYNLNTRGGEVQKLWNVHQIPSGQLLVSNSSQLFIFEKERFREIKYADNTSIEARCLITLGNQVFVGTYGQGFLEYKNEKVKVMYKGILPDSLGIFDILKDKKQRLWLATTQGAMIIEKGKVSILESKNLGKGDKCFDLCEDSTGNIWIASPNGLTQCRDRFIDIFDKSNGLLNDEIYSLTKDKTGNIYFGGTQGKLSAYGNGRFFQPFPQFSVPQKMETGNQIHFVQFDHAGNFWISCDADSTFKISQHKIETVKSLESFSTSMFEDVANQTLWFGSRFKLYQYKNQQWKSLTLPAEMKVDDILEIYQDKQKRLWIGTMGLRIFNGKIWKDLSKQTNTENVLIQAIKRDAKGNIWLATIGKGIRKLTLDKNDNIVSVENITTKEGLQNDSVLDIEFDNKGQLWVGSFGGIIRLNLQQPKVKGQYNVRIFNQDDGIIRNSWRDVCLLRDNQGNIWAGTSKGAMRFNLKDIPVNNQAPFVHITSALLMQSSDSQSNITHQILRNETLAYTQNSVSFHLDGINLSNPENVLFTYILDGLPNASWSALTKQNQINFSNLSPNEYIFRVKALNADNNKSSQEMIFSFTIQPPFWQTWWFMLFIVALVIGAIYWFFKRRERIINEKNQLENHMTELKLKALQSQMNPHFLFNSLNSIQNYILTNRGIDGAKYLSKFSKLVRRIMENSNHPTLRFEGIIETLKMYVEIESFRFNHEFEYQFDIEDDDNLLDALLPPMLLQPFVENAIWHGLMPKEGNKHLKIKAFRENNIIFCSIEDNGVGRITNHPKSEGHISRGQQMTKEIFDSLKQKDSAACLEIIDLYDENQNPKGTRVEMKIPM